MEIVFLFCRRFFKSLNNQHGGVGFFHFVALKPYSESSGNIDKSYEKVLKVSKKEGFI